MFLENSDDGFISFCSSGVLQVYVQYTKWSNGGKEQGVMRHLL
jgi:hypothetical protein